MNLLIAVEGCEAHRDRWQAQRNTWACELDTPVHFFTGLELGVPDDYKSLPAKTKAICHWALGFPYSNACIVDTDTYVHIPRLLNSGSEKYDYTGYILDWIPGHPYCSGPHYWLSRKALEVLAAADWSKYPVPGLETCEDVMVGSVLAAHGILPHHDPRYAPFTPVLPDNDIISQHLSSRGPYQIEQMYEAHRHAYGL
jgi:hypothetical protein